MKFTTRTIAIMALLIALSVVLTRLGSVRIPIGGVEGIRIGFGGLPIIMSGVLFGPVAGGIVGALADILGFPIMALGPYMPHFTLTSALTGVIPALVLSYRKQQSIPSVKDLILAVSIGQIITSVILVPLFIRSLFGLPLAITLPPRILTQAVQIPMYGLFIRALIIRLRSTVVLPRYAK